MAKYSRSALSMKESLKESASRKAEKISQHVLLPIGHRSIADLAHVALAIERLPFWRRLQSPTNNAGMARNVPPDIRISKKAD